MTKANGEWGDGELMPKIRLTIDGRGVEAAEGQTVLQAATQAGILIPTICDHKDLSPFGACRMCIVEIDGVRGFPTSCTTPAAAGMVVRTQSEELRTLRNRTLELMLSGHPNSCLVCPHREDCEKYRPRPTKAGRTTRCGFCSNRDECNVRTLAFAANPQELALPTLYSSYNLERSDPFMDRDYNLCILCGRCWRICEKIHGVPAISIIKRGKWARIGTAFDKSHVESGCTFCGACIDICPTGTLTDRYARWYGKPESETPSVCTLCSQGCSMLALTQRRRLIANRMEAFGPGSSLCALGRFAYPQIVNSPERLTRPMVREGGELIPSDWETALNAAAEGIRQSAGIVAVLMSESTTREDRTVYGKLALALGGHMGIVPSTFGADALQPEELKADLLSGKVQAVIAGGNFLDEAVLGKLKFLVVIDCLPSVASDAAHVVLPAAILSETQGTFRNTAGEVRSVAAVSAPPGEARAEWRIVRDLARAMGLHGFEAATAGEMTSEIASDAAPPALSANPRFSVRNLPARFRGHYLADTVPALEAFGLPASPHRNPEETAAGGFALIERREIVPNMHLLKIMAPDVAQYAKPGQFVILMAKETSERAPFTLVDWDAGQGSITVIIEEVGRSSRELVSLRQGAGIAHVTGPLGLPFPMEKKGTVVLGGGCYGIGAIYPIARALKDAGNEVICAIEGCGDHALYMEKEIRSVCHELLVATKDGSRGIHGGVQEIFTGLLESGRKVDYFMAIGCTFMMRMASEATRPFGIPTYVALNPIMVDGTGMCGACRVSIDGQTKFACADGPIFNGHSVDWDELFFRRSAYAREEIEALPQFVEIAASGGQPLEGRDSGSCGLGRE
jgi:NADH dehydrogenase/NADH:ubiquinone oxidoreductase subunit G/NAD(P)H-flavin reductase